MTNEIHCVCGRFVKVDKDGYLHLHSNLGRGICEFSGQHVEKVKAENGRR